MTDARVSRLQVEALQEGQPVARVSDVNVDVLTDGGTVAAKVSDFNVDVLTDGGTVAAQLSAVTLDVLYADPIPDANIGYWDGAKVQPAKLKGWWDGSTIQQTKPVKSWWSEGATQPLAGRWMPAFVPHGASASNLTTSVAVQLPTMQVGDLIIVVVFGAAVGSVPTAPVGESGWNLLVSGSNPDAGYGIYTKIAVAADSGASKTFDGFNGTGGWLNRTAIATSVYRWAAVASVSDPTGADMGSVTTPTSRCRIVRVGLASQNVSFQNSDIIGPDVTTRANVNNRVNIAIADQQMPLMGASSGAQITNGGSTAHNFLGHNIVLRPAY